jgi:hypothetical protein
LAAVVVVLLVVQVAVVVLPQAAVAAESPWDGFPRHLRAQLAQVEPAVLVAHMLVLQAA